MYNLSYLEREPVYQCRLSDVWQKCSSDQVCQLDQQGLDQDFRIDYSDPFSFDNLYTRLGLYCHTKDEIGLIGSLLFVGFAVSCLILPRYSDMYGRRPFYIVGLIGQVVVWIGLLFTTNLKLFYVFSFLFGCTVTGRFTLGYVCYIETIPKPYQKIMSLLVNGTDTVSILIATIYFAFIGRSWFVVQIIGIVQSLIGLALALMYRQESPRFLMEHGKIDQLIANMSV